MLPQIHAIFNIGYFAIDIFYKLIQAIDIFLKFFQIFFVSVMIVHAANSR